MSTINLLPGEYIQRRSQYRANLICLVLFAVVMGSVGTASLVSERTSRNNREVWERINAAYVDAARRIEQVRQLESQKREMLHRAEMAAALMERLPRSYVLAMLTNALPNGAALTSLEMSVRAVQPTVRAGGKPKTKFNTVAQGRAKKLHSKSPPTLSVMLNIKGKASTDVQVARFIANLARHELMEMVDLSYSKEAQGKDRWTREFQLTARLRPDADALDALQQPTQAASGSKKPGDDPIAGDGA